MGFPHFKESTMKWNVNKKAVLIALVSAVLIILGGTTKSQADYVDLTQGGIVDPNAWARCDMNGRPLVCVVVYLKDKTYLVAFDQKGEYRIYEMDEEDEPELIWSRWCGWRTTTRMLWSKPC